LKTRDSSLMLVIIARQSSGNAKKKIIKNLSYLSQPSKSIQAVIQHSRLSLFRHSVITSLIRS